MVQSVDAPFTKNWKAIEITSSSTAFNSSILTDS
ncbi:hypothetical protein HMPREF1497_2123, partial [Fusobacterium sp. CM21]